MPSGLIEILILLDGHQYGLRYWPAVPRCGDLIELIDSRSNVLDVRVVNVLWRRQDLREFSEGECKVTLWTERVQSAEQSKPKDQPKKERK